MRLPSRDLTRLALALACSVGAAAACDTDAVLDVSAPDVVAPSALTDTLALPVYLAGALSDFQVAYNGANDLNQVTTAGLFTDEFIQTESFPTRYQVDTRDVQRENQTTAQAFLDLQRARASAERASAQYVKANRPTAAGRLEALNVAGFSYILFGENYCSGVPISTLRDDFTIEYGQPQTTQQVLQAAVARFDSVLATAGAPAATLNAARVGRARALLDLGQFAAAGQAAAGVPLTFEYVSLHSENSTRQNNGVWYTSTNAGRFGVAEREAGVGLPFVSAADPRVPSRPRSTNSGNGFDGGPMRELLRYPLRTSGTVIADGVEAQLIRAEAALQAGDNATFLSLLNALRGETALITSRGGTGTLPALSDPGSAVARQDLLFRERAFWLFGTSHRLGDLRRLVRQYNRPAAQVFPNGNYTSNGRTGQYGSDLNLPIPIDEGQNPNTPVQNADPALKGCLSRSA